MKIALIGYGKMGKAIEEIALQRGHKIVPCNYIVGHCYPAPVHMLMKIHAA